MYNLGNADKNTLSLKYNDNKYYDANIIIDIKDANNTHSIIASNIKNNSTVLDVGCGAGYIGKLLINSNCELYGIDLDAEALKVAKKLGCYKELINMSIVDESTVEYKEFFKHKNIFDYIIFADVLEHIVDPGAILYNFSKLLKKNGKILISIPNIAHLDILKELTNRTFNYNKIGILDNTHLRFFTKKSFSDFIRNVNETYKLDYGVKLIGKTISSPGYEGMYPNLLKLINFDNESCVLQYVYELSRGSNFFENVEYNDIFTTIENCLQEKENIIKKIENADSTIQEQSISIRFQKDQIRQISNYVSELELTIKDKNDIIKEKQGEIDNLENKINIYEEDYYSLKKEYDDLCVAMANYKNEISKILNSRSWKVTRPLRKISEIINIKRR